MADDDANERRAARAANRGQRNDAADDADSADDVAGESEEEPHQSDPEEEDDEAGDDAAEPNRNGAPSLRNIVVLPKFSGKPSESKNVNLFLEKLDAFFEFHGYTLPRHVLPALYSCFPDDSIALRWYSNARSNGEITSYRTFKRAFKKHFMLPTADRIQLYAKFRDLRQRGTPVAEYHSTFIKLVSDLEAVGAVFTETDKVTAFVRGLKDSVQERLNVDLVREFDDMTLEKAFSLAVTYERILPREPARPPPYAPGLNAIGTQSNLVCYYCKKPGHAFNDCPKVAAKKAAGTWIDRSSK